MNRQILARVFTLALVLVVVTAENASAAMLNLTKVFPDITSGLIKVNYDFPSATFTANGSAASFDIDGIAPPDHNISAGGTPSRRFVLSMTVNPATGAPTGGTVNITGTIPALGANSGNLLNGSISEFGFPDLGGTLFEFKFLITGGDLASYYNGIGFTGGIILNAIPGSGAVPFTGSFLQNFTSTTGTIGGGVSDSFIVPEPASFALVGFAVIALANRRRRRD